MIINYLHTMALNYADLRHDGRWIFEKPITLDKLQIKWLHVEKALRRLCTCINWQKDVYCPLKLVQISEKKRK